jgi:hypothetical protein
LFPDPQTPQKKEGRKMMNERKPASISIDNSGKAKVIPDEVDENRRLKRELAWYRTTTKEQQQGWAILTALVINGIFFVMFRVICEWAWFGVRAAIIQDPTGALPLSLMMYITTTLLGVLFGIYWLCQCLMPIQDELTEALRLARVAYHGGIKAGEKAMRDEL